MADLKVSQLTETISLVTSDVFPVVNSGETKKVTVNNLSNSLPITTFVQGASGLWGGSIPFIRVTFEPPYGSDNLPNGTDTYLSWKTGTTSDSNIFELVNPNTSDARVLIKSTGTYEFIVQAVYFDLWDNVVFSAYLDETTSSTGSSWTRQLTLFRHVFGGNLPPTPGQVVLGTGQLSIANANRYYSIALNPNKNTPYPASVGSGTTFTNLLIRKVGV